jgi:hypothetical protein
MAKKYNPRRARWNENPFGANTKKKSGCSMAVAVPILLMAGIVALIAECAPNIF